MKPPNSLRLYFETAVKQSPQKVFDGFDQTLFEALNPPGIKAEVQHFGGCRTGDEVRLLIHMPLFGKQKWISKITDDWQATHEIGFVDEGTTLPFFLKNWKHTHIIRQNNNGGSLVIDSIECQLKNKLWRTLLGPALYLQFAWRKPVYKKFFNR